jgi:pimeloyl-ACP methyl ester carboxylesterase
VNLLFVQTIELLDALEQSAILPQHLAKQFHLIGLSMGGGVAVVYAAQNPERIKTLILLAPAGLPFELPLLAKCVAFPTATTHRDTYSTCTNFDVFV